MVAFLLVMARDPGMIFVMSADKRPSELAYILKFNDRYTDSMHGRSLLV